MDSVHTPHSHLPYGKPGEGSFGRLLSEQNIYNMASAVPTILDLIEKELGESDEKVFSIGDYGCADGSTSFNLIRAIIEIIRRKKGENYPMTIIYEDQVSNDFNSLFNRLHGIIDCPKSYLSEFKNVYTSVTASTFYNQCVIDNSLDVILTFMAVQWLPERATRYRDSLYRFPVASEEEQTAVAKCGAEAWELFLLQRAKELKPGGLLFVSTPGEDPDHGPAQSCITSKDLQRGMTEVWQSFVVRGLIDKEEFYETNFDSIYRNRNEWSAPFLNKDSAVSKAGMKLLTLRFYHGESIFKKEWRQTKDTADDRMKFAHDWVTCNRPWSNSTFLTGLSNRRSHEDKVKLVDKFYDELIEYLGQNSPDDLETEIVVGYVFVQKRRI